MKITVHRGIAQIGGCVTEIASDGGTRILIDLGHNLPDGDAVAKDEYDNPQRLNDLLDGVSHIFYTHYHGDHIGFEAKVPEGIRQHIGQLSLEMMKTLKRYMTHAEALEEDARTCLSALGRFEPYCSFERRDYGGICVTPLPVSHSAIDAHALLIECDGKTVLHTGDFRDHGYKGEEMLREIEACLKTSVDVLITEGTMLERTDHRMTSESQLKEKAAALLKNHKYAFVLCSSMNIDSITSFFLAAREQDKEKNRRIIADRYQIELFGLIRKYLPAPYNEVFAYPYGREWKAELGRMKKHGFLMFVRDSDSFKTRIDKVIADMGIEPKDIFFIYSMFDGYIDERHKAYKQKVYDFVHRYEWKIERMHTSGHASKEALERMCNMADPRVAIIPIHKERKGSMDCLELKTKCPVVEESTTLGGIEFVIR